MCVQSGVEFVSVQQGWSLLVLQQEKCSDWDFVKLQQFGLLRSVTVPTCIKGLSVVMLTELWLGGVNSGIARPFDGRD